LRDRRLPPGRSGDRDAARREQRERLFAAGHTADLPRLAPFLTYFALAPFIGAEEACDVANGRGRTGGQQAA
jgi:hypothetical protein